MTLLKLENWLARTQEVGFQMPQRALLQHVFEKFDFAIALHERLYCSFELVELGERKVA